MLFGKAEKFHREAISPERSEDFTALTGAISSR